MTDTLPDAEAVRLAAMRRLSPVARLKLALEMSDLLQRLARVRTAAAGEQAR